MSVYDLDSRYFQLFLWLTGSHCYPISHQCCLWLWRLKSCRDFCPCCQLAGFGLQQGRLEIWRMYGLRKCHDFYPNASRSWYMLWIALEPPGWGCQTINKQTNNSREADKRFYIHWRFKFELMGIHCPWSFGPLVLLLYQHIVSKSYQITWMLKERRILSSSSLTFLPLLSLRLYVEEVWVTTLWTIIDSP